MNHFTLAVRTGDNERRTILVHVYETQDQMNRAGQAHNGAYDLEAQALCQAWYPRMNPQAIIRLHHGMLGNAVLIHEIVHAAQIVYRWTNQDMHEPAHQHFTHHNEQFAHMVSDMYRHMKDELAKRYVITPQ